MVVHVKVEQRVKYKKEEKNEKQQNMKIAEIFKEAQYSRLQIGNRWLTAGGRYGWMVLEERMGDRWGKLPKGKIVCQTKSEDKAVLALLKGEPLYSDVVRKIKKGAK